MSGWAFSCSTIAARPDQDPGLGAAQELVAREADDVDAGGHDLGHRGLDRQAQGLLLAPPHQVALPRSTMVATPRVRQRRQLGLADLGGEADHREVRAMDLEQERGGRPDRALVVGALGLVGGADLAQDRARQRQDLRDAERAADLDQLAARHDHLAAGGQRGQRQHGGGGVVVDDAGRLGAADRAHQRRGVGVARPAGAARQIVLEVGGAAPDLDHRGDRRLGQRRAPQVGVDDHAGGVDHPTERRRPPRAAPPPPPRPARRWARRRAPRPGRPAPPPPPPAPPSPAPPAAARARSPPRRRPAHGSPAGQRRRGSAMAMVCRAAATASIPRAPSSARSIPGGRPAIVAPWTSCRSPRCWPRS
jgi:hypothetical protein